MRHFPPVSGWGECDKPQYFLLVHSCILTRKIFAFNGFGEACRVEQEGAYLEKSMNLKVYSRSGWFQWSHPVGVFVACNRSFRRVPRLGFGVGILACAGGSGQSTFPRGASIARYSFTGFIGS